MISPIALVTGGNRGIGFEVCRQLAALGITVLLTGRTLENATRAAAVLEGDLRPYPLDVADDASVTRLAESVQAEFGRLDILVNNAAINFDITVHTASADLAIVRDTLETNLFGVWRTTQAFLPLLRASAHPRIVNVSSEYGSFGAPNGQTRSGGVLPAYTISKAALNALTVKLATDLKDSGILVNAVCPGWTATTPSAAAKGARPIEEGAAGIVWAATLSDDGPSGGFFRDGNPLPW
jgi:NAD(P)-dependent dehydrogenase (short-subunit alcohol dehydrogenase family)